MNTRHKILSGLMGGVAALLIGQSGYAAYTVQATGGVPGSATVGTIVSLGVQARNISGDQRDQPAPSVSYGTVAGLKLADQYLRVTFRANFPAWSMSIHTDNAGAAESLRRFHDPLDPPDVFRGRAGGLLSTSTNTVVLPLGWRAFTEVQGTLPTVGDPASSTMTVRANWRFIKDGNDADFRLVFPDPRAGYKNVAFGGPDFTTLVGPELAESPRFVPIPLPTGRDFFHVYTEAATANPGQGSYSGTLNLDIYTE